MKAVFTFGSLLVVLAVVALSVRSQLHAGKSAPPPADAASTALAGTPRQQLSQYQRAVGQAMQADAQHTADEAASAADQAR